MNVSTRFHLLPNALPLIPKRSDYVVHRNEIGSCIKVLRLSWMEVSYLPFIPLTSSSTSNKSELFFEPLVLQIDLGIREFERF